jgi:TonB-linked SusC/RagA family outer membrane protein
MERKIIPIPIKRTMLKSCVLLLLVLFSVSMNAQITVAVKNQSLKEILKVIEAKTEYRFFYNEGLKGLDKITSLEVNNATVEQTMSALLTSTSINYKIEKKNLIVLVSETKDNENVLKKVTGKVTDEGGGSLPGVSVLVKGSTQAAITDVNGNYLINNLPKNAILQFTYIGMQTREVKAGNQAVLNVTLSDGAIGLSEVVAVGYGTVKKKDLTGAVGSISSADILRVAPTDATQALQGIVPGVVVSKSSNQPGATFNIDIRGQNTISGSTQPLYVIDGIIGAVLRDINPADIQSMDVLKDASSTAIYGSRGANGVVIISTKKGVSGKPRVTIDSYSGLKMPNHLPQLQNAQQFYQSTYTDVILNGGTPATFTSNEIANIKAGKSVNWVDLISKPALSLGTTVSVSGGSQSTTYHFSTGYVKENGSVPSTSYTKYSVNGNVDSKITDYLKIGITAYLTNTDNPTGSAESLRSAYRVRPTGSIYYSDLVNPSDGYDQTIGAWNGYAVWMGINDNQALNPLVESDPTNAVQTTKATDQMGSIYAELKLLKGLTFKSSISAFDINQRTGGYYGTYTKNNKGVNLSTATYATMDNISYTFDNQLNYNTIFGKHKIDAIFLQEAYSNTVENTAVAVQNLPYASLWKNLGTAGLSNITGLSSSYALNTLQSYMGRVNYSFEGKYLLTVTCREDGASQLAPGHKWGFFPSAALGWHIDEERFIKDLKVFSNLKLRVSYGEVGNSTVAPYATQASVLNTSYSFGQTVGNGFAPGNLGNKDLRWERSQELNLGLDLGFFNQRLTGAVELYNKNTKDLIMQETLPTSTGFSSVYANVGQIRNKGIEISLNSRNIVTKNWSWTTSFNFARNDNEVVSLANGVSSISSLGLFVGHPVKSYYDYKFAGIWQTTEATEAAKYGQVPGQVKVVDTNSDNKISSSTGVDDRQILGSQLPNFTMGLSNSVRYKDFDFSFKLYYRNGGMFYNNLLTGTMGDYTGLRYNHIVLNYWTKNNATNDYYGVGISQPSFKNAIAYQSASFLRVSDITLGYNVPKTMLQKIGVDRIHFYLQVTNPFLFTNYTGLDPEYNSNTFQDQVPTMSYTFGFNIGI